MAGPVGLPVIDTMIGFPHEGSAQYDFIRKQTKDRQSKEDFEFPVEYMFKDVPNGLPTDDPVSLVLQQMDRFGIEKAMIGVGEDSAELALKTFPDRFVPSGAHRRPQRRDGIGERDPSRVRTVRYPRDVRVPCGHLSPGPHRRPEDVSDLCHLRRTRHPDLRLCRCSGSAQSPLQPRRFHGSTS